ncbi:MAG TPA: hypothetical protein VIV11_43455, partial [Kofleriaceae bacterium]
MKRCPKCQTEYPDDANWCRFDGGRLEMVAAATKPQPPAQQPGALTMGWDAQPEPSAAETTPSMVAPMPGAPSGPMSPAKLADAASTQKMAQTPGALTMGWDAQPEPVAPAQPEPTTPAPKPAAAQPQPMSGARVPQKPGALTMGWDAMPEPPPAPTPSQPQPQPAQPSSELAVRIKGAPPPSGPRVP